MVNPEFEFKRKSKKVAFYKDKKRLAWLLLAVLKNNIVSFPIYILVTLVQYAYQFILLFVFSFQFRNNLGMNDDLPNFEEQILSVILTLELTQIMLIITLAINLLVAASIVVLSQRYDSPEKARQQNLYLKAFSFLLVFKSKVLFTTDLIFALQAFRLSYNSTQIQGLLYTGAIISIVLSIMSEILTAKMLQIRLRLTRNIPWSHYSSIHSPLQSVMKLCQALFLIINVPSLSVIGLTIISAAVVATNIYFQPYHRKSISRVHLYCQSIILGCYFTSLVVNYFDRRYLSLLVISLICSCISPIIAEGLSWVRQQMLKKVFFEGQLSTEAEAEQAISLIIDNLFYLNNLNCQRELVGLILHHKKTCPKYQNCFCSKFDAELKLLHSSTGPLADEEEHQRLISIPYKHDTPKPSQKKNAKRHRVDSKKKLQAQPAKRRNYNSDEEMKDAFQDDRNLSPKTLFKNNQNLQEGISKLDKKYSQKITFSAALSGFISGGSVASNSKAQNSNSQDALASQTNNKAKFTQVEKTGSINCEKDINIMFSYNASNNKLSDQKYSNVREKIFIDNDHLVNQLTKEGQSNQQCKKFKTSKIDTILLILYNQIIDYAFKFDDKCVKVMQLEAFFQLTMMQNKYLCHQTLTKISALKLGFFKYTQFLIDQQFLLDAASEKFDMQKSETLDIDKVISSNLAYQTFLDLNKESSSIVNQFWAMLSNIQNVDIQQLHKQGQALSEVLRATTLQFKGLQEEGQDKKNYNMYYLYANFNKFIINNDHSYHEYIQKMAQVKSINKTIRNTYKETLRTEVDTTGFIVVKGTFTEFGQILFVNRAAGTMLGYYPAELQGKLINQLMPSLISEKHHLFLQQFRKNGNPSFIERQQNLFIKHKSGYITPIKVFIKFHYDKTYGHVFSAVLNKNKYLYPYNNNKKYYNEEIMTIMTDNLGTICEITPSVTQYLGIPIKVVQQNQQFLQENIKIEQLLDIDIGTMDQDEKKECITTINPDFNMGGVNEISLIAQRKQNQRKVQQHNAPEQVSQSGFRQSPATFMGSESNEEQIEIKLRMTKVSHKGVLVVRYFFLEISSEISGKENLSFGSQGSISAEPNRQGIGFGQNGELANQNYDHHEDLCLSSSNGSSSDSRKVSYETGVLEKEIDILIRDDKRTPKSLKNIFWLVLLNLVTILSVSSVNLGNFITQSSAIQDNLLNYQRSLERIALGSRTMNFLRSFLNLKIKLETDSTFADTFLDTIPRVEGQNNQSYDSFLTSQILITLQELKERHQYLENIFYTNAQLDLKAKLSDIRVPLTNINSIGKIEVQEQSLNVAINLFQNTILDIVSNSNIGILEQHPLIFQDYRQHFLTMMNSVNNGSVPQQFQNLEQQKYFVFKNYISSLSVYLEQASKIYNQEALQTSQEDIHNTLITSLISICTILVVSLLVTPLFRKAQKRKYQVLTFFLDMDQQAVLECQQKSGFFESQFYARKIKKLNFEGDINSRKQSSHSGREAEDEDKDMYWEEDLNREDSDNDTESIQSKKKRLQKAQDKVKELKQNNMMLFHTKNTQFNDSDMDVSDNLPIFRMQSITNLTGPNRNDFSDDSIRRTNSINQNPNVTKNKSHLSNKSQKLSLFGKQAQSMKKVLPKAVKSNVFVFNKEQFEDESDNESVKKNDFAKKKKPYKQVFREDNGQSQSQALDPIREENSFVEPASDSMNYRMLDILKNESKKQNKVTPADAVQKPEVTKKGKNNKVMDSSNVSAIEENANKQEQQPVVEIGSKPSLQTAIQNSQTDLVDQVDIQKQKTEKLYNKIKGIASRQRKKLFLKFILIVSAFSSYFVGVFLLSKFTFEQIENAFEDIHIVYNRENCISELFVLAREDILSNKVHEEVGDTQGYNSLSMKKLWQCTDLESQYTTTKSHKDAYETGAWDFIITIDSDKLCSVIAEESKGAFSIDQCEGIQNGLLLNGLSNSNQQILKKMLIFLLDFFGRDIKDRTDAFLITRMQEQSMLELLYTNELMLTKVSQKLGDTLIASIENYLNQMNQIHVAIYTVQSVISVFLIVFFLLYVFNKIKKSISNGTTMLSILPKDQLTQNIKLKIKDLLLS